MKYQLQIEINEKNEIRFMDDFISKEKKYKGVEPYIAYIISGVLKKVSDKIIQENLI